ncbi:Protein kinase G11A [Ananas comosus]|uniref:non-specific serine/threonine protein kinase n=1 Tax=Ananas comosus TaxID=4615 RepID=A0A199VTV5_ANACO|nr:Protein kinase G11A [Ananas comosus]
MAMPDELADDLCSMSFGSSERSGSSTVSSAGSGSGSGSSSSSSSSMASAPKGGDPRLDLIRRLGSSESGRLGGALSPSDLRFVRRLGSGDIGSVYLAEVKCGGSGAAVAAKVMDKKELEGRSKWGRARTEREILEMVGEHPFLPRLYGVAENDRWSCLLTDFCPGGDLHLLRQRQPNRRFPDSAVRFYAAEVVAALEYVHMLGIVYRDLKPENVLVRSDGHIMLTDFDLSLKSDDPSAAPTPAHLIPSSSASEFPSAVSSAASAAAAAASSCILPSCIVPAVSCFRPPSCKSKPPFHRRRRRKNPFQSSSASSAAAAAAAIEFVAEPVDLRSMSFVGTHEYLAPEIVSGEGHGSAVDWWTLGVFIFELLYGATPFRGSDNDATLANIVARALEFPREPHVPAAARDLVAALLVKDPARRLGAAVGAAVVKKHPFFDGVNWALLRCAPPPYVPPPFEIARDQSEDDDCCPGTPVDFY